MRQLTQAGFERVARQFRVLGDPGRLRVLDLLRRSGAQTVGAIAEQIGCSQGHASRQLARLREAGFLKRRQGGTTVYYEISDPWVFGLCEAVCGHLQDDADRSADALFVSDPSSEEQLLP